MVGDFWAMDLQNYTAFELRKQEKNGGEGKALTTVEIRQMQEEKYHL